MMKQAKRAFTLTEIMIALALVAFLMVGISYIFASMSKVISTGQAASGTLRSAKAIQQATSNDFLGFSSRNNIAKSDDESGATRLIAATGTTGAPFFTISNYRVAAYRSEADKAKAFNPPTDATNGFITRSNAIRATDLDSDGTSTAGSTWTNGETYPIYDYGTRNFRCDTIGFFTHGNFQSQVGSSGAGHLYQADLRSEDAYVWYGHMRVFNSNAGNLDTAAAHGEPGMWRTSGNEDNKNNRYANQFKLGRYQILMVEPIDHDANDLTPPVVVAANDDSVPYLPRTWGTGNSLSPFNFGGIEGKPYFVQPQPALPSPQLSLDQRTVTVVQSDSRGEENFPKWPTGNPVAPTQDTRTYMGRTDIAAAGITEMRERVRDVEENLDPVDWWRQLPVGWTDRFYTNPFAAMTTVTVDDDNDSSTPEITTIRFQPRKLGQRQAVLDDRCTQFMVEFAGDFAPADGILDFDTVNGMQQVRWYGLPRDTSGDNTITPGTGDVLPVSSYGARQSFERFVPGTDSTIVGYPNGTREPTGSSSPSESGYVCVWGPVEFDAATPRLPQMVRLIFELSDEKERSAPMLQEFVYPLRLR